MPRLVLLLLLWPSLALADTFDIIEYAKPAGWTSTMQGGTLQLSKGNDFAIIPPSRPSDGSVRSDFDKTWSGIAGMFQITGAPQTQQRGDALVGAAQGKVGDATATIVLVELNANGKTISVIGGTTNSDLAEVQKLLGSVHLAVVKSSGGRTTSFGDGATASLEADWVLVTKGALRIKLHYPIALDDASRRDIPGYFWSKLVGASGAAIKSDNSSGITVHTAQAPVGGRYVMLRVLVENGTAWPIEVSAPSAAELPDQNTIAAFRNANRFAIGPDVAGAWSSFTSANVNLYYVSTGGYAGMNTATLSAAFTFDANGSYHSEIAGGTNGAVATEKHKGTYKVSTWELTTTHDGKTSVYDAYYEAVRGGLLLHLRDKQYTGMAYTLGRK